MTEKHLHVPDDQLLLHASGEMPWSSSAQIGCHLEGCSECRARLLELENALVEFARTHIETRAPHLSPSDDPQARLKARLAELDPQNIHPAHGNRSLRFAFNALARRRPAAMFAAGVMAACLLLGIWLGRRHEKPPAMSALGHWDEPDLHLTPGATLPVTQNQVCAANAAEIQTIPASLKRKVFEEYGVTSPQPDAFEVDYLITPELGGATDIRNLWPEPYQDTVWNAHVKDQLEDRLHRMVCHGDVDLATAQRDISTDWIAAYRKYFHADKPVTESSSVHFSASGHSSALTWFLQITNTTLTT